MSIFLFITHFYFFSFMKLLEIVIIIYDDCIILTILTEHTEYMYLSNYQYLPMIVFVYSHLKTISILKFYLLKSRRIRDNFRK